MGPPWLRVGGPRNSKEKPGSPRKAQEAPRRAQEALRRVQEAPRMAQEAPRKAQEAPRGAQRMKMILSPKQNEGFSWFPKVEKHKLCSRLSKMKVFGENVALA